MITRCAVCGSFTGYEVWDSECRCTTGYVGTFEYVNGDPSGCTGTSGQTRHITNARPYLPPFPAQARRCPPSSLLTSVPSFHAIESFFRCRRCLCNVDSLRLQKKQNALPCLQAFRVILLVIRGLPGPANATMGTLGPFRICRPKRRLKAAQVRLGTCRSGARHASSDSRCPASLC